MKKFILAAAACALLLSSCTADYSVAPVSDENAVTFTVAVDSREATRAYSDGTLINDVKCYVYDTNNGLEGAPVLEESVTMNGLQGSVKLGLASGRTYDIVFLATSGADSHIAYDKAKRTLSVDYAGVENGFEGLDAFYGTTSVTVSGPMNEAVRLVRPFARLNIGTDDLDSYAAVASEDGTVTTSLTVTGVCTTLNLADGTLGESTTVTFDAAAPAAGETFPVDGYSYLAMCYLLAPADETALADVVMTVNGTDERTFNNVPLMRNRRTNVYGSLLVAEATMNVEIMKEFNELDNSLFVSQEPKIDAATKSAEVSSFEQLLWLGENLQANTGNIKTVTLTSDINCGGEVLPAIHWWSTEAPGTFDGGGHTISNFKLARDEQYNGLFESVTCTIKNLNIENVTDNGIKTRFTGLVGNLYGTLENVHAKNIHITSKEGRVGVLVGIHNSGKLVNCSVTDCSVEGTWSVGGLVGATNETPGITYENCVVDNVTVTLNPYYGGVYNKMRGLMTGNINVAGVKFIDCEIRNCDFDKPIYNSFNEYTWNGEVIPADIDEDGNAI